TRLVRIVAPQPSQRIRKNRAAVQVVVEAGSPVVPVVVAGKLQRSCERLVRKPPAAGSRVEIVGSVLEDHANRFLRYPSNQRFVVVPSAAEVVACGDVREAA